MIIGEGKVKYLTLGCGACAVTVKLSNEAMKRLAFQVESCGGRSHSRDQAP